VLILLLTVPLSDYLKLPAFLVKFCQVFLCSEHCSSQIDGIYSAL